MSKTVEEQQDIITAKQLLIAKEYTTDPDILVVNSFQYIFLRLARLEERIRQLENK